MKHTESRATDHKLPLDWRTGLDAVLRGSLFAAFWWLLNEGNDAAWTLGIPTVAAATLISLAFVPPRPWRVRPYSALRFGLYFVRKSLLSSVDVAQRVFQPRIPIKPRLVRYPLRLKDVSAQVIVANTASLLPGTLSVGLAENILTLHVLDIDAPIHEELAALEKRVAAIFGLPLQEMAG
jgi:multicomponent Na+:H+ antiporter subunit E